jgi:DUF4097 and DUF4098 domain-containing protein YvlB
MASPGRVYVGGMYGVPPPRRHSLLGPLILISVGVVFLLRNFGYRIPLLHNFVRYWPLLLVAAGVVRLVEHIVSRREQRAVPRMGAGTVFLLLVVIAAGIGLNSLFHRHEGTQWDALGEHMRDNVWDNVEGEDELVHLFGDRYSYTGEQRQPLPEGSSVRVTDEHGTITVNHWEQPEVRLVYHRRLFAGSQSDADLINRQTAARMVMEGTTLEVRANTDAGGAKGVVCDLDVYVPVKANVLVTAGRGGVSVSQRTGEVKVNARHGDVTVDQVAGNVTVIASKGSLHASNVTGNLTVDGRLDDLGLDSITGLVFVKGDIFGDTRLSKLEKGVTIRTSRTELQIARLDGDLAMNSGDLQGDGVQGPFSLSTKAKDVNLRNLRGDVHIEDDTGDINLESTSVAALGNVNLTTHHGDVRLRLPAKANFQYQVVTRHGDIASDFESLRQEKLSGAATASGRVGKGGMKISVTSDTGDVEISKVGASTDDLPSEVGPSPKPGKAQRQKVGDVEVM